MDARIRALLLFSGGLDSTVALWHILKDHDLRTVCLHFTHGLKPTHHITDLSAIINEANDEFGRNSVTLEVVHLPDFWLGLEDYQPEWRLKAAEGPTNREILHARNLVYLSLAVPYAIRFGANNIFTGFLAGVPVVPPDATLQFSEMAEKVIHEAIGETLLENFGGLAVISPMIAMDKLDVWKHADQFGILGLVKDRASSCNAFFINDPDLLVAEHSWGWGCGKCQSCEERANSWEAFQKIRKVGGKGEQQGETEG